MTSSTNLSPIYDGWGIFFFNNFYKHQTSKHSTMILTTKVMKQILDKLPDDYEIYYNNTPVQDKIEIDVSDKKIILKS